MTGGNLGDALSDMWRSVLLFVPTALAFVAILIIGYVLARLARTVVAKALHRIGFDRAVERGAIGRALGGRVEPSDLCAKITFYGMLLFALQLGFGIWGPNAVSDLLTALVAWLPRAFVAIVIIVVAAAIGGAARDLVGSALGGLPYGPVLARAGYWLIVALGVIAALDQVQIATAVTQPVLIAVLATVAGVLIVGVGGGLIRPMQRRWEIWLDRAGAESSAIREHARSYAAERARVAAEKKAAEEARLAEEARRAEAARVEAEAEAARRAEAARAEAEAEAARRAEAARVEAEAEAARRAEENAARRAAEEAQRQRDLEAAAAEKTQVIPVQQARPGSDDRPHLVPGFDDPEPDPAGQAPAERDTGPDTTAAIPPGAGGAAGRGGDADTTAAIPPDRGGDAETTATIPAAGSGAGGDEDAEATVSEDERTQALPRQPGPPAGEQKR